MSTKFETTAPIQIGASMVVSVLRTSWEKHMADVPRGAANDALRAKATKRATAEVLTCRDECVPMLSDEGALRIARGEATLRGWSNLGLTYHDAPDNVVGEYIHERDDSGHESWVAPVWFLTEHDEHRCTIAGLDCTSWSRAQWVEYGKQRETVTTHEAAEITTDGTVMLAQSIADELAADPSTVSSSTVTVHDGAGNVLATATAPAEPEVTLASLLEGINDADGIDGAKKAGLTNLTTEQLSKGVKS